MEKNNITGSCNRGTFHNRPWAIIFPIQSIYRPKCKWHIKFPFHTNWYCTVWWPYEWYDYTHAKNITNNLFITNNFILCLDNTNWYETWMCYGMIANFMSFFIDTSNQFWIFNSLGSQNAKCCPDMMRFEDIKNNGRIFFAWAIVKSKW